jgi:hypothetical protein
MIGFAREAMQTGGGQTKSMNGLHKALLVLVLSTVTAQAAENSVVESVQASTDAPLQTDPTSTFWRAAHPAYMERDKQGKITSHFRSEIRARWTKDNLYFLFSCLYDELHLKPSPTITQETNELWNWDVAEVFISSDFNDIKHYQEFEVSPQGEWIDLDVDLRKPHHEDRWIWNSGFTLSARTDAQNHRWYAAMRIPLPAIDKRSPTAGMEFRLNLFVSEGPPANHHAIAWQPPMSSTFHVPERFGTLRLIPDK